MLRKNLELDIKNYISEEKYYKNKIVISKIKNEIIQHKAFTNPILKLDLRLGEVPLDVIQNIHMDYRNAIVEIFTDALLAAALSSHELESKYGLPAGAKMIPRALLIPNFLDEFGLRIESNQLIGSVKNAHYSLFENVVKNIQVMESSTNTNSDVSENLRCFFEKNYKNHYFMLILLAVAELQVIYFTPFLEKLYKLHHTCKKFDYYYVHGTKDSHETQACDDEHAEDLWMCLVLIADKIPVVDLTNIANKYLDLWDEFWLYQFRKI